MHTKVPEKEFVINLSLIRKLVKQFKGLSMPNPLNLNDL